MASTIATLIASTEAGDRSAADALFSALYAELLGLARRQLAAAGPGVTLGPTTLLHEAYLNISQREGAVFPDRPRFVGYAAKVMRGLIVDHARNRSAQKRGGRFRLVTLQDDLDGPREADDQEIVQVGAALEELGAADPPLADVVDLKFFCGFSFSEIAAMRGVSERTVQRQWEKARIYLRRRIREAPA
ncbi:MAG: ECF-type sigma factor [Syntrophomonadaceae bacterium]